MTPADQTAACVQAKFASLPQKCKPRTYPDGRREWTILSGIIMSRGVDDYTCVALGTGLRCLPQGKIHLANGVCLHDWHAEVVAIRAFNVFLLQECLRMVQDLTYVSPWLQRNDATEGPAEPFAVRSEINISMYTSMAPCGDASMELTMSAQEDGLPWPDDSGLQAESALLGRGHFSQLGIVRRKPSRADAPQTLSKSCSDKLALKQCTSLLMSLTSMLISPGNAYLQDLILPEDQTVASAIERSFGLGGRFSSLDRTKLPLPYTYRPLTVKTTTKDFDFARHQAIPKSNPLGCNVTAMTAGNHLEILINGTLQGRKQFSPAGASAICRKSIWQLFLSVRHKLGADGPPSLADIQGYGVAKGSELLLARQTVKDVVRSQVLRVWVRNTGDEDFAPS